MTAEADIEPTYPFPPKYWWLKRISAACAVLLALLFILRLIWGWDANRRLQAEIDAVRTRGEPLLPEDFKTEPVVDAENYVFHLKQAMSAINAQAESPAMSVLEYQNVLPLPPMWYPMAENAGNANQKALSLIRAARQYDKVYWELGNLQRPLFNSFGWDSSLNQQRQLATLLADTAQFKHLKGDDNEAVKLLLDLFSIGHAGVQRPTLISFLVGTGIDARGLSRVYFIAPGLNVGGNSGANREDVNALIKLQLESPGAQRLRFAMLAERMMGLDTAEWMIEKTWLLGPMYVLDNVTMMRMYAQTVGATIEPIDAKAVASLIAIPDRDTPAGYPQLFSRLNFSMNHVLLTQLRVQADERMAAVALATRLYQIDHGGRWPSDLEALVPAYLPAVPLDPASHDGAKLKYLLTGEGKRPVVYSVGGDGKDDTATGAEIPPGPIYSWNGKHRDDWRDLSRFDPPQEVIDSQLKATDPNWKPVQIQ